MILSASNVNKNCFIFCLQFYLFRMTSATLWVPKRISALWAYMYVFLQNEIGSLHEPSSMHNIIIMR